MIKKKSILRIRVLACFFVAFAALHVQAKEIGKTEPLLPHPAVLDQSRMIGFHIDMNIMEFKGDYLRQWLRQLADLGYNTIIWEVEHNIQWDTCPECASPQAFSKAEFKKLLEYSRGLGLEPIPVLQTLAHVEYVLKHPQYRDFAERESRIDQYCPRHPGVAAFLGKWMAEYLELFGEVRFFHIGADEAELLGACDDCKAYAEKHSLSQLYIDHINAVSQPLIERDIRPIIWGDMILHHPQAIDRLCPNIMIFDWQYNIFKGTGQVVVWGQGLRSGGQFDQMTLDIFGPYLYPYGDEPGRDPEFLYTSDFLADKGFDVVTCPSSNSRGDTVWAPTTYRHMRNTYDFFHKGRETKLKGTVLTSWTVRLSPWELQQPSIEIAPFVYTHPCGTLEEYQKDYVRRHFGVADQSFFAAAGLFAKTVMFSEPHTLGFYKSALPVDSDFVDKTLDAIAEAGALESELQNCRDRLREYQRGLELLDRYKKIALKGHDELKAWDLAARNLINRAQAADILLKSRMDPADTKALREQADHIVKQMRQLKAETQTDMSQRIKPKRVGEIMDWMYASMETALVRLQSEKN